MNTRLTLLTVALSAVAAANAFAEDTFAAPQFFGGQSIEDAAPDTRPFDEASWYNPLAVMQELGQADDTPLEDPPSPKPTIVDRPKAPEPTPIAAKVVNSETVADQMAPVEVPTEAPMEVTTEVSSPAPQLALVTPTVRPATRAEAARRSDIWAEVSSQFGFPSLQQSSYAQSHRNQLNLRDGFFAEFLKKSEIYLPYVWQEVKRRGLPSEIALLPFVESAYNPWAVSPMGAVGMWQIMPGTAKILNLEIGRTCDQRRDIIHSTRAALDYLELMHEQFGDWLLAIAAYNAGPGRIDRAIQVNRRAGRPTDFWSLSLPRETRRYIPRLLVTRDLIATAQRESISLPAISTEVGFRVLQLEAPMEVGLVQELSGLPLSDIRRYNPCITSWITPAQEPYQVILPEAHAQQFSTALVSVSVRDYVRTRPYEIQSGDTLGGIAARFGATVAELMKLNSMKNTRIVAGKTLRVPSVQEDIIQQIASLESGFRPESSMRYQVQSGDSLWKIAQQFGTSIEALRRINRTNSLIRPGDILTIPLQQ